MAGGVEGGVGALIGLLPWLLLGAVLLIGAAMLIWWLYTRSRVGPAPADRGQQSTRENIDGQIQSMLTQAGGAMDQTQIRANLGLPVEEVAAALRRLEDEGRITRLWQPDGYTYLVRTAG
jgi:hypothetical protein